MKLTNNETPYNKGRKPRQQPSQSETKILKLETHGQCDINRDVVANITPQDDDECDDSYALRKRLFLLKHSENVVHPETTTTEHINHQINTLLDENVRLKNALNELTRVLFSEDTDDGSSNDTITITPVEDTTTVSTVDDFSTFVDTCLVAYDDINPYDANRYKCNRSGRFSFLPSGFWSTLDNWMRGNTVDRCVQYTANDMIHQLDSEEHEDMMLSRVKNKQAKSVDDFFQPVTRRERYAFIADVVAQCKCEIPGIGEDTKANRLVGHHWLNKQFVSRGMRPSHIKTMLPKAVECLFIDNRHELEAKQFAQSHAVVGRMEASRRKLISRENPWLLNWRGTKRSRPAPQAG